MLDLLQAILLGMAYLIGILLLGVVFFVLIVLAVQFIADQFAPRVHDEND